MTYDPRPATVRTAPCSRSQTIARLAVVRATPNVSTSSFSDGTGWPGCRSPDSMRASIHAAICRCGGSFLILRAGTATPSTELGGLTSALTPGTRPVGSRPNLITQQGVIQASPSGVQPENRPEGGSP
jgi:hypothetical protein